jgi:hypothetical protein
MRVCGDQGRANEDVTIKLMEIYVHWSIVAVIACVC